MIEEHAIVLSASAGIARVEAIRRDACGSCSARGACGTSLLDRLLGRRRLELELEDAIGLSAGDEVIVGVPEEALVVSAFIAYMVPLIALIVAALIGAELAERIAPGSGDGWSLVSGLAGLSASLVWVRAVSRRIGTQSRWRARLLRRVGAKASTPVSVQLR